MQKKKLIFSFLPNVARVGEANGRVYDPLTAQFFSPDPYVQAPDNWLNYNRYSYCFGNPFKYTDPSGEYVHVVIGAFVGGFINLGIKAFQGKINSWGDGFAAFGIGAVAGVIGAATGGAAFAAAGGAAGGAGGFLAGAAGGAIGTAYSSPVLSMGNTAYFGDPMMTGEQYLMGIAGGALFGGAINGGAAILNGRTFWNGTLPTPTTTPMPPLPMPTSKTPSPDDLVDAVNSRHPNRTLDMPEENFFKLDNKTRYITIKNSEGVNSGIIIDPSRDPNFRQNLINASGINPGKNVHAHHNFPIEHASDFIKHGIDPNKYGSWWNGSQHLSSAKAYNNAWSQFFQSHSNPSQNQIFQEALRLKQLFGY